jgi:hypothetical protein
MSKEVKIIEEKEYINEEGKVVKEQVIEVITKVVLTKVKRDKKEKSENDDAIARERRHNYYLLNKTELNELSRKKKVERYASDPEYREKIKARRRENYLKKKEKEKIINNE